MMFIEVYEKYSAMPFSLKKATHLKQPLCFQSHPRSSKVRQKTAVAVKNIYDMLHSSTTTNSAQTHPKDTTGAREAASRRALSSFVIFAYTPRLVITRVSQTERATDITTRLVVPDRIHGDRIKSGRGCDPILLVKQVVGGAASEQSKAPCGSLGPTEPRR